MNDEPTAQLPSGQPDPPPDPDPREPAVTRLTRPRDERVVAGVCSGIARYFAIDPVITRIAAVGLVFLGGVGIILYLAAWLLVPEDGAALPAAGSSRRAAGIAGGVAVLGLIAIFGGGFWWPGWLGGPLVILAVFGAAIWWLVRRTGGTAAGSAAGRIVLGLATVIASVAAVGIGFWAAGLGGGAAVAGLLVVAGIGIMAAAFAGGARWLIAPAIALALGTGIATAADVDLRGDYGERTETPRSIADLPESYDMGAGSLIVDLRNVAFPAGETHLKVDVGLGEAVLVVPPSLCVVPDAHVGVGEIAILGRRQEGVDLDRLDTARATDRRLVVDAKVGIGSLRVTTDPADAYRDGRGWDRRDTGTDGGAADRANAACIAGTQG